MKNFVLTIIGFALLSILFVGCKKDEPTPKFMIQAIATEGGTIDGQSGEYEKDEYVVFKAIPSDGYFFDQWSDGSTDLEYYITVSEDVTITAQFQKITITTVDLGLESGTLWATCNLGASRPWDYGDYYAWGETEPKEKYSSGNYKFWVDNVDVRWLDSLKLTKYCSNAKYGFDGFTDSLTTLQPNDDAATAVWGTEYSTPTLDDWTELVTQCYLVYTSDYNNHKGIIIYKAKSDSDKGAKGPKNSVIDNPSSDYSLSDPHIFLPFAGWKSSVDGNMAINSECSGRYWSASRRNLPHQAYDFSFDDYYSPKACYMDVRGYDEYRHQGFPIRPVKHK